MTSTSTLTHAGRIVGAAAVILAVTVTAFGTWFHGASSASAPEPVRMNSAIGTGSNPAILTTPNAVFVTTKRPTIVYYLSGTTWTASSLPAGQPCSTTPLAAGQLATKVVVATSAYRKCL